MTPTAWRASSAARSGCASSRARWRSSSADSLECSGEPMMRLAISTILGASLAAVTGVMGGAEAWGSDFGTAMVFVTIFAGPQAILTRTLVTRLDRRLRGSRGTTDLVVRGILGCLGLVILIPFAWGLTMLGFLAIIGQTVLPLAMGAALAVGCLIGICFPGLERVSA